MKNRFREEFIIALVASKQFNYFPKEAIDGFIDEFCKNYGHDLHLHTDAPKKQIFECHRCGKIVEN